jgi:hypothetical protein
MAMFNSYVKLPEGTGYDDITRLSRQISAGIEPIETQITMDASGNQTWQQQINHLRDKLPIQTPFLSLDWLIVPLRPQHLNCHV